MAELSANDFTVLALVAERPTHGWALAEQLARGAPIGTIWAIGRPTVYHTLDKLERVGLVSAVGLERGGRGPHRVIYAVTGDGRKVAADCLSFARQIFVSSGARNLPINFFFLPRFSKLERSMNPSSAAT